MKKLFVFSMLLLVSFQHIKAQDGVVVAASVAIGHAAEVAMLKQVRDQEEKIAAQQLSITATTSALLAIEAKVYEGLTKVQSVITNATVVIQITQEGQRIVKLSEDILEKTAQDPQLAPIIINEVNNFILEQGLELSKMTIALTGGDVNLMNNKERLEIMENLLTQLKLITKELYSINRLVAVASWTDVFQNTDQLFLDSGVDYNAIYGASLSTLNELKLLRDFSTQQ